MRITTPAIERMGALLDEMDSAGEPRGSGTSCVSHTRSRPETQQLKPLHIASPDAPGYPHSRPKRHRCVPHISGEKAPLSRRTFYHLCRTGNSFSGTSCGTNGGLIAMSCRVTSETFTSRLKTIFLFPSSCLAAHETSLVFFRSWLLKMQTPSVSLECCGSAFTV
jgi:hypothetical protein